MVIGRFQFMIDGKLASTKVHGLEIQKPAKLYELWC